MQTFASEYIVSALESLIGGSNMTKERTFFVSFTFIDSNDNIVFVNGPRTIKTNELVTLSTIRGWESATNKAMRVDSVIVLTFQELEQPDEATVTANVCTNTALMKALRKIRKITRNHRSSSCAVVEIDDIVSPFLDKAIQIGGSNRG